MLFHSIDFAIFLPVVFILYWFVLKKSLKLQNLLIAVSSYIFYGWWDWRFLFLLLFSSVVDFLVGLGLDNEENKYKRKALLWTSIIINLGFLGFFKYFNFFVDSFVAAFTFFGYKINGISLDIILPVGISFYTFQTLSYSIDVYKRKLEPTHNFIDFSAFVSFFPQLVAGPIERATNLLPQFYTKRTFDVNKAIDGLRQILWGLFKKVVIADNCAEYANLIFNNSENLPGSTLILGGIFFTIQVYGDFSGYSDIAIGTSRLFGFELMRNFAYPFFSRDISEFWRRWHISLSTWFRDYLYVPLGGSRGGMWMRIRNTFIIFIVSGFWHGANWTFVIWGALNAFYMLPLLLLDQNRNNLEIVAKGKTLPTLKETFLMIFTFGQVIFGLIIFRSEGVRHAIQYLSEIFSSSVLTVPKGSTFSTTANHPFEVFILIGIFFIIEWIGREEQFAIAKVGVKWSKIFRWSFYYLIIIAIILYSGKQQEFIYFQF